MLLARAPAHTPHSATAGFRPSAFRIVIAGLVLACEVISSPTFWGARVDSYLTDLERAPEVATRVNALFTSEAIASHLMHERALVAIRSR